MVKDDSKTGGANKDDSQSSKDLLQKALMTKGSETSLDISLLTKEEQQEIVKKYQQGLIDIRHKADELRVDVGALSATLTSLGDAVADINASGNSATISHTQDSSAGRTEIMVGNTEKAAKGKLSRSQTGEFNWIPVCIGGAVIVAIIVILAIFT